MTRKVWILALGLVLAACGSPHGPAPVVYHGAGPAAAVTSAAPRDESVPDAAPLQPVETAALVPAEPGVAFDAQAAAHNSAVPTAKMPDAAVGQGEVVAAKLRPASIRVVKGDTLFSLSEKYQIALKPLIEENNLKAPYGLKVGQSLKLPPPLHYRVRRGDTLMAISRRFAMDYRSLALINGIEPPFALRANDILMLPTLARGADGHWKSAAARRPSSPPVKAGAGKASARKRPARVARKAAAVHAPAKTSVFTWPLRGPVLSGFGPKPGGTRNDGINIGAPAGTAVRAAGSGTVVYAGAELKSFGKLILIRHPNGWVSAYAHNRKLLVREGARVKAGDSIAEVGATGAVATPQLHFETRRGRTPVNPLPHLPKRG